MGAHRNHPAKGYRWGPPRRVRRDPRAWLITLLGAVLVFLAAAGSLRAEDTMSAPGRAALAKLAAAGDGFSLTATLDAATHELSLGQPVVYRLKSERDAWLLCMQRAIAEQDYAPEFAAYLLQQLRVPAERVLTTSRDPLER